MRNRAALVAVGLLLAGGLQTAVHTGAAPARQAPSGSARIEGVPHVLQQPDFCGEACAAMYLARLGKSWSQDDVFGVTGLDPALGRGAFTGELTLALNRIGFRTGEVRNRVKPEPAAVERVFRDLHADLLRGVPSIVCTRYDETPDTTEHFRLVLGYDAETDEVVYHEPAAADGAGRRMSRERFLSLWPLKYRSTEWLVVRIPLEPSRIVDPPERPDGVRFGPADYLRHVRRLKEKLPGEGFTIVVEPPFVVVGDEPAERVRRRAAGTVEWAARRLRESFFASDPLEILDVWLFRDKASYEQNAKKLFGRRPDTPFGYYSSHHHALVMNIDTGGGTLVHEIVHPFVEANFPDCPPWFNEGLGSLYEQCRDEGGKIAGLTNWRLRGLKKSIREKDLPTFEALTAMDGAEFYGSARGDNYAQARYLLYYLQEKGLLRSYYRKFHAARKDDPTGYDTLVDVLGEEDMKAFQARWEKWVLSLVFR